MANATWDPATVTAVTLSGGNLVATNTGTTSADQGARVAAANGKATGKYYFEVICTTTGGGLNNGAGVGTTASTYTGMGNLGGVTGAELYFHNNVYINNANPMAFSGGGFFSGNVIGIAVDLDNRKIWFRKSPNVSTAFGNWNDNATYNPATNVGGLTIPAGTMVPFVTFGGSSGVSGVVFTANFGDSAFVGAVPAGFTSGWPGSALGGGGYFSARFV